MEVRYRNKDGNYSYGNSSRMNTAAMAEAVVYFDTNCDSIFFSDLEVKLPDGSWKDMNQAFTDKDIVPNNLNTAFDYPHSEQEYAQGFNWF